MSTRFVSIVLLALVILVGGVGCKSWSKPPWQKKLF
jgi:hypothetical protein